MAVASRNTTSARSLTASYCRSTPEPSSRAFHGDGPGARDHVVPCAQARLDRDRCIERHGRGFRHRGQLAQGYDGFIKAFYLRHPNNRKLMGQKRAGVNWPILQTTMVVNQVAGTPRLEPRQRAFPAGPPRSPSMAGCARWCRCSRAKSSSGVSPIPPTLGGFYLRLPAGLHWRQIAQDGVQFANQSYQPRATSGLRGAGQSHRPAGAGADSVTPDPCPDPERHGARPSPADAEHDADRSQPRHALALGPGIGPAGDVRTISRRRCRFLNQAPQQPVFLADIQDWELRRNHYSSKTLTFDSKRPGAKVQHTINGIQFAGNLAKAVPGAARRRRGMDDHEHHRKWSGRSIIRSTSTSIRSRSPRCSIRTRT